MRYVDDNVCTLRLCTAIFDTHAFIKGHKMTSILGLNMLVCNPKKVIRFRIQMNTKPKSLIQTGDNDFHCFPYGFNSQCFYTESMITN